MFDFMPDMKTIGDKKVMDSHGNKYKLEPLESWDISPSFLFFLLMLLLFLFSLRQQSATQYQPQPEQSELPLIIENLNDEPLSF